MCVDLRLKLILPCAPLAGVQDMQLKQLKHYNHAFESYIQPGITQQMQTKVCKKGLPYWE